MAIEKVISNAFEKSYYTTEDLLELNERWHCFDAHSQLSSPSKEKLLSRLNSALKETNEKLTKATHVIITLGTAWVYRHIKTEHIVGNCHKVAQKNFSKELLSIEDIAGSLKRMIKLLENFNPKMNILFTVSPVRHLKDGFVENSQSKAHLLTAIHEVISNNPNIVNTSYFPSFEIMMDDLRDYRFYDRDLIHPNPMAIDYIWDRFKEVWIDKNALSIMKQVEEVQKGLMHKPFNENSDQHQEFLKILQNKIQKLKSQHQISF